MKTMVEQMQDNVIRKYGFENPLTIHFCSCVESFEQIMKDKETKDKAIKELYQLVMNYE